MRNKVAIAAAGAFVLLGLASVSAGARRGQDKLQFSLPDAFGRQVRSQDYKGVPIFLEFGACW